MKIASYNISGGYYVGNEDTEYLDREAATKIDSRLLDQIIETVNSEDIDVICFQEIITTESVKYLEAIKEGTNLKNYDYFELSPNNLVENTNSGLAIFSKYPIDYVKKEFFPNPRLSKTTSTGNTYYLFDKGYMICKINGKTILTHHGFPFRKFNSTPEDNPQVFKFFDDVIKDNNVDIITGDFNAENFMDLMPNTNNEYKRTVNAETTTDGKKFDDVLVHKNINASVRINKLLSDHYMVIENIDI